MLHALRFSIFALLTAVPSAVLAWSATGHAVNCELALQALDVPVCEKVKALICLDMEYNRFSAACHYPDRPRKRSQEHYVKLSRSVKALDPPCPMANQCVTTAIIRAMSELALATNDHRKLEALKYLGHWVADVYQSLHVAFRDDKGGNDMKAQGTCSSNVHAVWEICILENKLGTDAEAIAHGLRSAITPQERADWTDAAVSIAADVEYCLSQQGACGYQRHDKRLDADEEQKVVSVDDAYLDRPLGTLETRLKMAGVRLAQILNLVLSE